MNIYKIILFLYLNTFAVGKEKNQSEVAQVAKTDRPEVAEVFRDFYVRRRKSIRTLQSQGIPIEIKGIIDQFVGSYIDQAAAIALQAANLRDELSEHLKADRYILRNMLQTSKTLEANGEILRNSDYIVVERFTGISDLPTTFMFVSNDKFLFQRRLFKLNLKMKYIKILKGIKKVCSKGVWSFMSKLLPNSEKDFDSELRSLDNQKAHDYKVLQSFITNLDAMKRLNKYESEVRHKTLGCTTEITDNDSDIFPGISSDELRALLRHVQDLNEKGELVSLIIQDGQEKLLNFTARHMNWEDLKIPLTCCYARNHIIEISKLSARLNRNYLQGQYW